MRPERSGPAGGGRAGPNNHNGGAHDGTASQCGWGRTASAWEYRWCARRGERARAHGRHCQPRGLEGGRPSSRSSAAASAASAAAAAAAGDVRWEARPRLCWTGHTAAVAIPPGGRGERVRPRWEMDGRVYSAGVRGGAPQDRQRASAEAAVPAHRGAHALLRLLLRRPAARAAAEELVRVRRLPGHVRGVCGTRARSRARRAALLGGAAPRAG